MARTERKSVDPWNPSSTVPTKRWFQSTKFTIFTIGIFTICMSIVFVGEMKVLEDVNSELKLQIIELEAKIMKLTN